MKCVKPFLISPNAIIAEMLLNRQRGRPELLHFPLIQATVINACKIKHPLLAETIV